MSNRNSPVYIHNIKLGSESHYNNIDWIDDLPDYAGGFGVHFEVTNTGSKIINYVKLTFTPINGVGDIVGCTARNHVQASANATGPFSPGETKKYNFDKLWYNETIKTLRLDRVEVKYADGAEETISVNEATEKPKLETDAAKYNRLNARLKEINSTLASTSTTEVGIESEQRTKNKIKKIIGGIIVGYIVFLWILYYVLLPEANRGIPPKVIPSLIGIIVGYLIMRPGKPINTTKVKEQREQYLVNLRKEKEKIEKELAEL